MTLHKARAAGDPKTFAPRGGGRPASGRAPDVSGAQPGPAPPAEEAHACGLFFRTSARVWELVAGPTSGESLVEPRSGLGPPDRHTRQRTRGTFRKGPAAEGHPGWDPALCLGVLIFVSFSRPARDSDACHVLS